MDINVFVGKKVLANTLAAKRILHVWHWLLPVNLMTLLTSSRNANRS